MPIALAEQAVFRMRSRVAQLFPMPLLIVRPLQLSQWIGNHLLKFMDNQLSFLLAMDCADG